MARPQPEPIQERRAAISASLDAVDPWELQQIIKLLQQARHEGWTVYVAGNGGSAANAQHLCLHLRQARVKVVDLTAQVPLLTAISNDSAYAECFSQQVEGQLQDGDVIFVISGSGNSANILRLLVTDSELTHRIALLGMAGGIAKKLCHYHVTLESKDYAVIEDVHSALIHLIQEGMIV